MRSSWFPRLGAALFAAALVHLGGCTAAESLVSSSRSAASNAAAAAAAKQTLLFEEEAVNVGERARSWRASQGVDVGRFASKSRQGVSFKASAGARVRARSAALPGMFGSATKATVRLSARNASRDAPVTVRFDFDDAAGVTRYSQPVTFHDARWKDVTIRLPARSSVATALVSPMRDVASWGLSFEDDAEVRVQRFELWRRGAPEAPAVGLGIMELVVGEPASMKAARGIASSWLRDEPVATLDGAFDGLLSLHRQISGHFPGVPDIEEEAPLTTSLSGGAHMLWGLAASAVGEPHKARKPRSPFSIPKRSKMPLPWTDTPW